MRKRIFYGFSVICAIALILFCLRESARQGIVINEVSGTPVISGGREGGMENDYVELYNPSVFPVHLDGMYLSDNQEIPEKLSLGGNVIEAKGFLVIELVDGESPFQIKSTGESICLSVGTHVTDRVDCGEMDGTFVYAREKDGEKMWKFQEPTPGKSNGGTKRVRLSPPEFSAESGYYEEAFSLEISGEKGCNIYYTTDGSRPDDKAELYQGPIRVENISHRPNRWNQVQNVVKDWKNYKPDKTPVDKIFLVRAVAIDSQGNTSQEAVGTYLVDMEEYRDKSVVSLVADEEDLFGDDGIYVTGKAYDDWYLSGQAGDAPVKNFGKSGRDYEIPANFSFLEDGKMFSQNVGIRIQGNSSRESDKKRFSIYARKEYGGSRYFDMDFFPGKRSHSLLLRADFADAFASALVEGRDVAVAKSRPVTVFLNGEYWYDTYLREKYSASYVNQTYGVKKDDVIIVKNGGITEGSEDDFHFYGDIYAYYSTHDFTKQEGYQGFDEVIDIQSYIDFLCANIYLCNLDMGERKNFMLWRTRNSTGSGYSDGRWRMMLFDMDALGWGESLCETYRVENLAEINTFSVRLYYVGRCSYNSQGTYVTLKQNPSFCRQFVTTFMDMVNTNFHPRRVAKLMEEWGMDMTWNDSFFLERPGYICPYLAEEFDLKGSLETVTIESSEPEGGRIRLNTVEPELENGTWSGNYYTDYPVTVTAEAKKGYVFEGWSGAVETKNASVEVPVTEGGIVLKAVFRREG